MLDPSGSPFVREEPLKQKMFVNKMKKEILKTARVINTRQNLLYEKNSKPRSRSNGDSPLKIGQPLYAEPSESPGPLRDNDEAIADPTGDGEDEVSPYEKIAIDEHSARDIHGAGEQGAHTDEDSDESESPTGTLTIWDSSSPAGIGLLGEAAMRSTIWDDPDGPHPPSPTTNGSSGEEIPATTDYPPLEMPAPLRGLAGPPAIANSRYIPPHSTRPLSNIPELAEQGNRGNSEGLCPIGSAYHFTSLCT